MRRDARPEMKTAATSAVISQTVIPDGDLELFRLALIKATRAALLPPAMIPVTMAIVTMRWEYRKRNENSFIYLFVSYLVTTSLWKFER
jgi:hypothetical protein